MSTENTYVLAFSKPFQNERATESRMTPSSRNQRLNNIRSPPKPGKATNAALHGLRWGGRDNSEEKIVVVAIVLQ
jgi:hypothetical protein